MLTSFIQRHKFVIFTPSSFVRFNIGRTSLRIVDEMLEIPSAVVEEPIRK